LIQATLFELLEDRVTRLGLPDIPDPEAEDKLPGFGANDACWVVVGVWLVVPVRRGVAC
jgi:hypothetical protein